MRDEHRFAVDTSVAMPLLVATHEAHDAVKSWARGRVLCLSGHALAETYSVLTRLPRGARVNPADAVRLIDSNFGQPMVLRSELASEIHRKLAYHGVAGGAAYDGVVGLAAREHGSVLATRDSRARSTYEAVGTQVELIIDEKKNL